MRVLVTGATGFIGRAVTRELARDCEVSATTRRPPTDGERDGLRVRWTIVSDLRDAADRAELFRGVEAVVHLAGRAHAADETSASAREELRRANVESTERLFSACIRAHVSRFVFMSSIGAVGSGQRLGYGGSGYREDDEPRPDRAYGVSKLEAETRLRALASGSGTRVVVLRPPLVVGPQAPGNLRRLARAIRRGVPLPFRGVANRRTLVSVEGVASAIRLVLERDAPEMRCYHLAHAAPLSTEAIVRSLARGAGVRPRLVPFPAGWIEPAIRATRWAPTFQKLWGSLVVDAGRARTELNWVDPVDPERALEEAAGQ